jgi:hypothetical protein
MMPTSERGLSARLCGVAALGVLASVLPLFVLSEHLPDPLATHFGVSGAPDGHLSGTAFAALLGGQVLLATFLAWPRQRAGRRPLIGAASLRLAAVGFTSTLSVMLSLVTLWHNWERPAWDQARTFEWVWLLPLPSLPVLVAGALGALELRRTPRPAPPSDAPHPIPLSPEDEPPPPDERLDWSGTAANGWFPLIGVGVLIEGGVLHLALRQHPVGAGICLATHLLVLVVLEHISKIRVSADERGLTIRYGRLGWLAQRIPLDRILSATAFDLEPWDHGGWGYRGSLTLGSNAAVVVRSGRAVRLALREGTHLSITVDDAETAALRINGLIRRNASATPLESR